jgi:hypothetical protein
MDACLLDCKCHLLTICIFVHLCELKHSFNPILHIASLDNHALTSKSNTAKYYFGGKSSFLHTFLKLCRE